MNSERMHQVILGPIVSEKSTVAADSSNQVVFKVLANANKNEVREAVEKSLQRGRLVRINLDGHGERTAFMGTMASLGCALLLGTIFVLVFSAAILSLVPENRFGRLSVWIEKVPWILAAIMILFLLVQFLAFVIPRRTED